MKIKNIFLVLAIILNFTLPPVALAYHYEHEHTHHNRHHSIEDNDANEELEEHEHECDYGEDLDCQIQFDFIVNDKFSFKTLTEKTEHTCKETRQKEHKTLVELHIKLTE